MWTSEAWTSGTYVQMAMRAVNEAVATGEIKLPGGYNIFWSGQYEYMLRARERLMIVVPLTLLLIIAHHLPEHEIGHQDRHRDAGGAVLARGRVLGAATVRLQFERGRLGGHHRARRPRRRNRRGDAALPGPRLRRMDKKRRAADSPRICATRFITARSSGSAPKP